MSIVGYNWLNLNEIRNYPLEDGINKKDDYGNILPDNILVDAQIRFPDNLNLENGSTYKAVYISALTITKNLITLVLLGVPKTLYALNDSIWNSAFDGSFGDVVSNPTPFIPIATLSVIKPVVPYKNYIINPLVPGVSGWIMFGAGVNKTDSLVLKYSNANATLLSSKAAYGYKAPMVNTLNKLGTNTQLTGLITVLGKNDVTATVSTVSILEDNTPVSRKAVVLELANSDKFIGPCNSRIESDSCSSEALKTLNGVSPDCNGNFTILFTGIENSIRVSSSPNANVMDESFSSEFGNDRNIDFGIILDSYFGSDTICSNNLPDSAGNLPGIAPINLCSTSTTTEALKVKRLLADSTFITQEYLNIGFTLYLNKLADTDFTVTISTDTPDSVYSIPSTVTVPTGSISVVFNVSFIFDVVEREVAIIAEADSIQVQDTVLVLAFNSDRVWSNDYSIDFGDDTIGYHVFDTDFSSEFDRRLAWSDEFSIDFGE